MAGRWKAVANFLYVAVDRASRHPDGWAYMLVQMDAFEATEKAKDAFKRLPPPKGGDQ